MKQRGKKRKKIKRNDDSLRDLWDNVKCLNIQITGVPEEENKRKVMRKYFPKMGKEIATQVQETQRIPNKINPR